MNYVKNQKFQYSISNNYNKIYKIYCFSIFLVPLISQNLHPKPISKEQIINRFGYSLSYNEEHEQANWVAYELNSKKINGKIKRKNNFKVDLNIKTGSANLLDYKKSGYDRGHLAPAADMKWSKKAMDESFYLTNISPQFPAFNRGIWYKLEKQVRQWAIENESVYIVTAGVLKNITTTIGTNQVSVPNLFYKVILDYKEPELKGIGFILQNQKLTFPLQSYAVTIDEVELLTGIDFFHSIQNNIEEQIESNLDLEKWIFK